ncbi:TetR family transcriptional regulator [Microterricola gilva]|uniref:TetR family transcriptional regulator n=1 Tax=Microterricola gilva TaxID=393267 RepID=A0A4Q8APQ8_9MICO|nr:TetR/AcrR family transcriptional regulator [Microterricola gilva]RZU66654.1 TetR family transcriptional regulator [Microterricola gilva]
MTDPNPAAAVVGRYPKGERTRERIIRVAAELFAERGYTSGSMREIAARAGLAQAGLRHHFPDKFELLIEVLRLRDASVAASVERDAADSHGGVLESIARHSVEHPGLTSLYRVLSAEAGNPEHPAHEYFRERYARALAQAVERIRLEQDLGIIDRDRDPNEIAATSTALLDGLQIQAALVDDFDPVPTIRAFVEGCRPR